MSTEYAFSYIQDKCIQCYGCEVACKSWRDVELGVRWRRVENFWYGRYPKIKNASSSIACMHCAEPACEKACPETAIIKRPEDGIVIVDRNKCIGCKTCLEECPFDAPQFGTDGIMQKCDMCIHFIYHDKVRPPCVETCPTSALQFGRMSIQEKMAIEKAFRRLGSLNKKSR
jgi:Fe-S-cluster-containing dehydrogenase component